MLPFRGVQTARAAETAGPSGLRVLVVDDDDESRLVLERAIERLGHPCSSARDGEEALRLHRAEPFDVIIADWVMPGVDGLELCRRTRGSDERPYTYFIFATGLGDKRHMLEGMRAGADDYLTKPIDLDQLEARLVSARRVISLHRRLAQRTRALRRDSQRLFQVARTDPLTEIDNRLRMHEDLEASVARARRYGQRYCAAICDIDYFKRYNDRFGHLAGDEALRMVAQTIRATLRQGDGVYRYGGEEFLVILTEQTIKEASAAMERVRAAIERLTLVPDGVARQGLLTISTGVAELRREPSTEWVRRADEALYRAKRLGRNRVELAQELRAD